MFGVSSVVLLCYVYCLYTASLSLCSLSLIFLIISTLLGLKICILSSKLLCLPMISSVPTSRGGSLYTTLNYLVISLPILPLHCPMLVSTALFKLLGMFQLPPLHGTVTSSFFPLFDQLSSSSHPSAFPTCNKDKAKVIQVRSASYIHQKATFDAG